MTSILSSPCISTPWVKYTPASIIGFGTPIGVEFFSRRLGGDLLVRAQFAAGTSTATEARIELGFNGISGNVLATDLTTRMNTGVNLVGIGVLNTNTASIVSVLAELNTGYLTFGLQNATNAGSTKLNGNQIVTGGQGILFTATVPIKTWN